jgi:hypothetical protein
MSDFIIPKGKEYKFTVRVIEKDSFLPQDLTTMTSTTVELIQRSTGCKVESVTPVTTIVLDAINGMLEVTMPSGYTDALVVERGDAVDGYYLKPVYQCIITVKFSNLPDVLSIIDKVYVTPTGCIV